MGGEKKSYNKKVKTQGIKKIREKQRERRIAWDQNTEQTL